MDRRLRGAGEGRALQPAWDRDGKALKAQTTVDLPVAALEHAELPRMWALARVDARLGYGADAYPTVRAAHAAYVLQAISLRRFDVAAQAIADYRKAFLADTAFPVKTTAYAALVEGRADSLQRAVSLFDQRYQPLWPDDLTDSHFQLLDAAHQQHAMLAAAKARLAANPDDWMASDTHLSRVQAPGPLERCRTNSEGLSCGEGGASCGVVRGRTVYACQAA